MLIKLLFIVILASSALSKIVPRYANLDEDEQILFRAAYEYESPTYEHEEYQEAEEPSLGKLDLLKDGMWAIKAKIKELKTFDKALAANLLATKLQMKQLLGTLKKHHHVEIEKKKPVYHYQSPSAPAYHHYEPPHYSAPAAPEYHQPPQHASPQYGPLAQHPPHYEAQYAAPAPTKYEPPAPQYPPAQYESQEYAAPQPGPVHDHDPYNGF